jgi:crotonobetainyl-CoA:carnitine CoA-transferase CaiB-like acyl-CoA transferase
LAREIIARSDVVVENFRPGVMDRLGLGWSDVHRLNPAAVMLSLSTYGQTGPDSKRPGYAPVFAAEGGLGFMTGYPDGAPGEGRNPTDHQAGLMSALVVVAMLEARDRDGIGAYADASAREIASMFVGESILLALAGGVPHRMGNDHEDWFPHGVFRTAGEDAWIAIAIRSDAEWAALVAVMGAPRWVTPEMATVAGRRRAAAEIDAALQRWLEFQAGRDVAAELQAHGIGADVSMTAKDLVADEHLRARGSVRVLEHDEHGRRITVGVPWRFSDADVEYDRWSPALGEHNHEVLGGLLGHSDEQIAQWSAEGAVR